MNEQSDLYGVLERIIFFNEDNSYCIGSLRVETKLVKDSLVTIVGTLPNVQCGETLALKGTWQNNASHGKQFKIESFSSQLPSSVYGIKKYLGSGLVHGIGKVYAKKIVDYFGEKTLDIITNESARIKDVPGIGPKRAKQIKIAWDEQKIHRQIMMFLQTYGVSVNQCVKIVKKWGLQSKQVIEQNPYVLAKNIDGIGFSTADKIALNLGFANESKERIEAGILHTISLLEEEGHTCYPRSELFDKTSCILNVNRDLPEKFLQDIIFQGDIVELENGYLQTTTLQYAESVTAESLRLISSSASKLPKIDIEKAIIWAQQRASFDFASEQSLAISTALSSKISIITGGPGTGKTTILRALCAILLAKKCKIALAAPTGRAAKKMTSATGVEALTVHRLLKFEPATGKFFYSTLNPLELDFIIVDEASMLDAKLAAAFFRAIGQNTHLLIVGDCDQLPSVGAGNVLKDLIKTNKFPVIYLKQIFRQNEQSLIVKTAHQILNKNATLPVKELSFISQIDPCIDLHFINCPNQQMCLDTIIELYSKAIPKLYDFDPLTQIQILAPMHKGVCGVQNINYQIQQNINKKPSIVSFGVNQYKQNDKVIQIKNNYDKGIFNGDMGIIKYMQEKDIFVDFDDLKNLPLQRSDLLNLSLAYAISIHKSQGSEFDCVIIPLVKAHFIMLQRNLIYTAITRGAKKVFLVGDPLAYSMAVKKDDNQVRITNLCSKILNTI